MFFDEQRIKSFAAGHKRKFLSALASASIQGGISVRNKF